MRKDPVLQVVGAALRGYAVAVLGAISGWFVRGYINLNVLKVPPFHCYTYVPPIFNVVVAFVLIGPALLALVRLNEGLRLGAVALISGTGVVMMESWSEANLVTCTPL